MTTSEVGALRPYQRQGVAFLASTPRALLADEMGLGKTVQVLTAISMLRSSGQLTRALVVVPASLRSNWLAECRRWLPGLGVRVVEGTTADRRTWYPMPVPILIASYEQVRADFGLYPPEQEFDLVVLDEAQRVKSPYAESTIAVARITTTRLWALTGTPLENRAGDLVTLLRILRPGSLGNDESLAAIHEAMQGIFLRRRKRDVLPDLPPILEQELFVDLAAAQRSHYDALWAERNTASSTGDMLGLITRLKQLCNRDPSSGESGKLEAILPILDAVVAESGKLIIFSQFVETLKWLREALPMRSLLYHGEMNDKQRDAVVGSFRSADGPAALLVSIKAGGVGLNIPEASHVLLFDRWWNPATEDQAIGRAHRFGRTSPLIAIRLLAVNTIEDRIAAILAEKREVFASYVDDAPMASAPAPADLRRILDLDHPQPQKG